MNLTGVPFLILGTPIKCYLDWISTGKPILTLRVPQVGETNTPW